MIRPYVGIVTSHGLETFFREEAHTARFLFARQKRLKCFQAACVWFLLEDDYLTVVMSLMEAGHADGAWAFLQDAAREYGTLLPEDDSSPDFVDVA